MSLRPESRRRRAEVNIVPLVDVLITLIFFFLVTMQFRDIQTLNVTLPEIETAGKNTLDKYIDITITEDGTFFFNGQVLTRDELPAALNTVARINPDHKDIPVVIRADKATMLDNVTHVMDLCRKTGFEDFRLQAE